MQKLSFLNRPLNILSQEVCRGSVENFFPESMYQAMASSFPEMDCFDDHSGYGKAKFHNKSAQFPEFLEKNPVWQGVWDYFSSQRFINEVKEIFGSEVAKVWPLAKRPWLSENDPHSHEFFDVEVTMEFSRLGTGAAVPPHTDSPTKVFSLLFYMGGGPWEESYGGGTEFYQPKELSKLRNWYNFQLPFEEMKLVDRFSYSPNRGVFFVKNDRSWHGVSPLKCPPGVSRNALLVNIHHPYRNALQQRYSEVRRKAFPVEAKLRSLLPISV